VRQKLYLFLLSLTVILDSCSHTLKPIDYVHYVEDPKNGLHPSHVQQPFLFSLQYKPLDYVALQEIRQLQVSEGQLEDEKRSFGTLQYFTFRISSTDSTKDVLNVQTTSDKDYSQRQNYFDFYLQRDIKLIENGDTLPCRLFHCVRSYGLTPYSDFVLGFDNPKDKRGSDIKFVYEDKILKSGTISFLITQNSMKHIPQIKTD
jgi:hypothetical protein